MGNTDIAWLAGLFDGEGTIGFYRANRSNPSKGVIYQKNVCVDCANIAIIVKVQRITEAILGHSVDIVPDYRRNPRTHVYFKINLHSHDDILRFLTCIEPYLEGKKAEAQLMLTFLHKHEKGSPYTEEHNVLVEALKIAKRAGFQPGNTELNGGTLEDAP